MNIEQAYSDWSASYDQDRNLTRDLDEQVTKEALSSLRCDTILELGCGTGKNTALLSTIGRQVHAVDFSASMVGRARQKISSGNVTFMLADVTQPWPFVSESFDLVVCNLVLEHVADLSFVFDQESRVMRRGGRFFLSELHPFRQYQGTQANFRRGESSTQIQAFVHHLSDFLAAAAASELALFCLKESWHEEDGHKPPRLVSFVFQKP
jgi:ubiquinone/menaquinone biosynthesis C-methylase UbiE